MSDHPFAHCLERRELLANEERYRLGLAQRYSYVLPEPNLLDVLQRHSPIVELGAGAGYWAYLLRCMGVDIVAYDNAPLGAEALNRYHPDIRPWTDVLRGDITIVSKHRDRSLFLCWPPRFSALWETLRYYQGDVVLLVGDGGTRTLRMDGINHQFTRIEVHAAFAVDPAPGTEVQLSVWRRKR